MAAGPSIAVTADLHWGHHARGDDAARLLVEFLNRQPPDLLLVAGDIGTGANFASCLSMFEGLPGVKALVVGNHDIWVRPGDARGNSQEVYERLLAEVSAAHGFHYLEAGPLILPAFDLAVAGSMNWYDYSWSIEDIRRLFPADEWRVAAKRFTRGQHNDANFVRWDLDDVSFTAQVAERLAEHLDRAVASASRTIVVTHHPPCRLLSFPESADPPDIDRLLWRALMGNDRVERLLESYAGRIALTVCGHIHRAREASVAGGRGYNIGGDYHFKRLLWFDSPESQPIVHEFGNP
jgi:predicted phosphohydrolase